MGEGMTEFSLAEVEDLAFQVALACGANRDNARSLAASITAAEADGMRNVGLAHLPDYCDGLLAGRIDGQGCPVIRQPTPIIFQADGKSGLAHPAFDAAFEGLIEAAQTMGMAVFALKNAYTCGAAGYFATRLAGKGLVALVAANAGPASVASFGTPKPVFGTNPLAFSVPVKGGPPLLIDQSSCATTLVDLRTAAKVEEKIPAGWALDADGNPTTDPTAALLGALMPFGGYKGSNIALMVEMLAAGLTGASWSCDAAPFNDGRTSPNVGLFVLALNPSSIFGGDIEGEGFEKRIADYLKRFEQEYSGRVPGKGKSDPAQPSSGRMITVDKSLLDHLRSYLESKLS